MFDVIGKRNWFFAFSLLITIPGLIFILLGPITGGKVGLQYAIDFTGGTVWTIKFEDAAVTGDEAGAANVRLRRVDKLLNSLIGIGSQLGRDVRVRWE